LFTNSCTTNIIRYANAAERNNKAAQAADSVPEPDFSRRIRASLPTVAR
jgi:hypothetical protein